MSPKNDYADSYYARTLSNDDARGELSGTVEADVCVIGGGMAGLATALGLAERGKSVVVVEAKRVGWGASGRNGGFVGAGFSLGLSDLTKKLGKEKAHALYQLSSDCLDLIEQRIEKYQIDCGPVQKGILSASWFDDGKEIEENVKFMNEEFGFDYEFMPREKIQELYSTTKYYAGQFNPRHFSFHSLNFTRGIAAAVEGLGGRIYEMSPATATDFKGAEKRVFTEKGEVKAQAIVFACSGYIGHLEPRLSFATLPVGTYVMLTEPLGNRLSEAIRAPYGVSDHRIANDYYRPLPDTRILWGGRISAVTNPSNLEQKMLGDMLKIYPQLEGTKVEVAWPGTMGYSTHKMPQIGKLQDGVWYNQGYGGHGMNATTMGGEIVAAAIAENDRTYEKFEPFGLTFAGGPIGPLVAQTVYYYYQLRDLMRGIATSTHS